MSVLRRSRCRGCRDPEGDSGGPRGCQGDDLGVPGGSRRAGTSEKPVSGSRGRGPRGRPGGSGGTQGDDVLRGLAGGSRGGAGTPEKAVSGILGARWFRGVPLPRTSRCRGRGDPGGSRGGPSGARGLPGGGSRYPGEAGVGAVGTGTSEKPASGHSATLGPGPGPGPGAVMAQCGPAGGPGSPSPKRWSKRRVGNQGASSGRRSQGCWIGTSIGIGIGAALGPRRRRLICGAAGRR